MFADQKAIDYFTNNMVLAKVNAKWDSISVDAETGDTTTHEVNTEVSAHYKVSAYPTLILIDADGNEIDRIVGYMEVDDLIETVNNYQQGIGTLADLLSKADGSEDRTLFFEIADKYKYRGSSDDAHRWYLKTIEAGEPADSMSGESKMALADMSRRAKDYDAALAEYVVIAEEFDGTSHGADAEIYIGYTNRLKGDTVAAIAAFESFIERHPDSEDVDYAQKQIIRLKGEAPEETQ